MSNFQSYLKNTTFTSQEKLLLMAEILSFFACSEADDNLVTKIRNLPFSQEVQSTHIQVLNDFKSAFEKRCHQNIKGFLFYQNP